MLLPISHSWQVRQPDVSLATMFGDNSVAVFGGYDLRVQRYSGPTICEANDIRSQRCSKPTMFERDVVPGRRYSRKTIFEPDDIRGQGFSGATVIMVCEGEVLGSKTSSYSQSGYGLRRTLQRC